MIRRATVGDIPRIIELLHQVNMVHHVIRPDLFKPNTTKYNEQELETLLTEVRKRPASGSVGGSPAEGGVGGSPAETFDAKPIFVFVDDTVLGYAFCQITEVRDNLLLQDAKTLYIDDICVDEAARGRHVGKALYEHVLAYAKSIGCHNVTLNVWEGNHPALSFYRSMGMRVQKTTMEVVL